MKPHDRLTIFVDESSQTQHRYLTLGCLVLSNRCVGEFEGRVSYAKLLEIPEGELKWTKVSSAKLFAYKLVVDCFFDSDPTCLPLHFHSVVIDMTKRNERLFNAGSREIGFNKEIYQLLNKCARLYPSSLFDVYPDYRDTPSTPEDLRIILNHGRRKSGDPRPVPFRKVQFRDSKEVLCLQMVDLLLGGMSYRINGHHLKKGASPAKNALSQYILERAKIGDPTRDTAMRGKYTIWHRRLK